MHVLGCGGLRSTGSDLGHAPTYILASRAVAASHIKWRKMGTDVSLGPIFLRKKKIGGLADVSTGLIFVTKKNPLFFGDFEKLTNIPEFQTC